LLLVIVSSIGCFYYIRLIKSFFFVKSSKNTFWISSIKRQYSEYVISCFLFLNLFFIAKPTLLTNLTQIICVSI
jgi:NADH:ubiquinone oxidoreductase subunit 2 (subunit N)